MMYVCGQAATSAQQPQAGCSANQPATVGFTFLQQARQAKYYRAFSNDSLSRAEMVALAEQHLRQAAERAGWPSESWHEMPVFIGSSSYLMSEYENRHPDQNGHNEDTYSLLLLARDLQKRSGNPNIFSFATACTSSAHALIQADNWLLSGLHPRAFVLGLESLNRLTLLHFHSLGLFTDDYRPFGGNGLMLGEGIAALACSSAPQSASALRLVAHAANTATASAVQSDSLAQADVIRRALAAAQISPEHICAVKTHGIGTQDSDAAELQALQQVFGTLPPLLAFKPRIGHTLGASTALETALLAEALQQGGGQDLNGNPVAFSDGHYLSNHFGFGGSNTAMVWQWTK
ncbi:MAG: beta-ketoacyl synthase N-terminal-like domain-containing protein [Neisseria zoodegmatis]|uniref:beta-ketoacyl synthase N-terminal-like domain-containing protein n=1 Tax=Neisseria zoodegmatis TaxID=326523 RepID=UPI0026EF1741|nr:beta-ketoacyl synthase N-terminal-like domain-containing protein [Neisseria zoodegmatis]MDO5069970.1 beta-ketoacyl synthase N-terminal-like domain-containing protein [Neisseria zoodegmatis]